MPYSSHCCLLCRHFEAGPKAAITSTSTSMRRRSKKKKEKEAYSLDIKERKKR
jgi:hypothetical protein